MIEQHGEDTAEAKIADAQAEEKKARRLRRDGKTTEAIETYESSTQRAVSSTRTTR